MKRYFKVLGLFYKNSLMQTSVNPILFLMFFVSKLIRYGMFILMLYFLVGGVKNVGGYSQSQMAVFYLVFTFTDTFAQIIFREVYRFRPLIVSGDFDLVLAKPIDPLFRSLMGGPDFIDVGVLGVILIILVSFMGITAPSLFSVIIFLFLFLNSFIIVAGFHIFALALGVLTTSVDQFMMLYRDISSLTRIPVDVYVQPLQFVLTYLLPIGIIFTILAKALLGILSPGFVIVSSLVGAIFIILSINFWRYCLKQYSSACS